MKTLKCLGGFSLYLLFIIGTSISIPPALFGQEATGPVFDLRVNTDYHLNQDGRPTPSYDFLVPLYADEESLLFFNPRYHIDDQTNLDRAEEWNLGLGYRHMIGDRAILGANVYYDWLRSMTGNQFEQIGAGIELLTDNTTARLNGYLALSGPAEVNRWREYYFAPRSLNYIDYVNYEVPQSGVDGEIGFKVPYISDYCETWVYGGGYYFTDDLTPGMGSIQTEDMAGYKGRIEVKLAEWLSLEFEGREDNIRGTDLYGQVKVEVPFSIENLVAGKNPFEGLKKENVEPAYEVALADRMYEKVERDPDVITGLTGDVAMNNGALMGLVYVKNSFTGTSNGDYGTPYKTIQDGLDALQPNPGLPSPEVLFVLAGNTTTGYPGFTVNKNYTTIWGQGYKPLCGLPHSLAASYPKITGPVTINATNVEIMGLNFTTGSGITIGASRDYAEIHHNTFNTGTNPGILVNGGIGSVIHDNTFTVSRTGIEVIGGNPGIWKNAFTINNSTTGGVDLRGIYGNMASGDFGTPSDPLVISGNTFTIASTYNPTGGAAVNGYGIYVTVPSGDINTIISDNSIKVSSANGSAYGIKATCSDLLDATVTGNTMSGGITAKLTADGISLASTSGAIENTTIDNNILKVTSSAGDASGIDCTAVDSLSAAVRNNNLTAGISGKNLTKGVSLYCDGFHPTLEAVVSSNKLKVTSSGGAGIGIFSSGYDGDLVDPLSSVEVDIRGNDLSLGVAGYSGAEGILVGNSNALLADEVDGLVGSNKLKVTASTGDAVGIDLYANDGLTAIIQSNNMSLGISGKYLTAGVRIVTDGELPSNEAEISGNILKVTSSAGDAYGIFDRAIMPSPTYDAGLSVIAENNNMSSGISGLLSATGIHLESDGDILGEGVAGNKLKVTSTYAGTTDTDGWAFGICGLAAMNIVGLDIEDNDMTAGVTGKFRGAGIDLQGETICGSYEYYLDADSETETVLPLSIAGNAIKVTSSAGDAFGVYGSAVNHLSANIDDNDMSLGIAGKYTTSGIHLLTSTGNIGEYSLEYLYTDDGSSVTEFQETKVTPVSISGNKLKITSSAGEAYGVMSESGGDISADIVDNDMLAGITGNVDSSSGEMVAGVHLHAMGNLYKNHYYLNRTVEGGYEELLETTDYDPILIGGNLLKATNSHTYGEAHGINIYVSDCVADILSNNMSSGITGKEKTTGICIEAGDIGEYHYLHESNEETAYDHLEEYDTSISVSYNVIKATSSLNDAYGIYALSETELNASIIGNNMSAGITGTISSSLGLVSGIYLETTYGRIGSYDTGLSRYEPVSIIGNNIKVTNNKLASTTVLGGDSYGVYCDAGADFFGSVTENFFTVKANRNVFAAYIKTDETIGTGVIGDSSLNTYFNGNTGTVEAVTNRYLLGLMAGNTSGVDYINWNRNTITPVGGAKNWTGNYAWGETLPQSLTNQNQPVWTNLMSGDHLVP